MRGIMHPYILSDAANDTSNNGILDIEKHTREGQKWVEEGLVEDNEIIPVAGVVKSAPFDGDVKVKIQLIRGTSLFQGKSRANPADCRKCVETIR